LPDTGKQSLSDFKESTFQRYTPQSKMVKDSLIGSILILLTL
jgi:hypothetical protein